MAFDISIIWDGGSHATWSLDISEHEAISMASRAPIYGWASWRNGDDLLLAYQYDDLEVEGWARVPGAAPGRGHKDLQPHSPSLRPGSNLHERSPRSSRRSNCLG